jgi:hypothetical protein
LIILYQMTDHMAAYHPSKILKKLWTRFRDIPGQSWGHDHDATPITPSVQTFCGTWLSQSGYVTPEPIIPTPNKDVCCAHLFNIGIWKELLWYHGINFCSWLPPSTVPQNFLIKMLSRLQIMGGTTQENPTQIFFLKQWVDALSFQDWHLKNTPKFFKLLEWHLLVF